MKAWASLRRLVSLGCSCAQRKMYMEIYTRIQTPQHKGYGGIHAYARSTKISCTGTYGYLTNIKELLPQVSILKDKMLEHPLIS